MSLTSDEPLQQCLTSSQSIMSLRLSHKHLLLLCGPPSSPDTRVHSSKVRAEGSVWGSLWSPQDLSVSEASQTPQRTPVKGDVLLSSPSFSSSDLTGLTSAQRKPRAECGVEQDLGSASIRAEGGPLTALTSGIIHFYCPSEKNKL